MSILLTDLSTISNYFIDKTNLEIVIVQITYLRFRKFTIKYIYSIGNVKTVQPISWLCQKQTFQTRPPPVHFFGHLYKAQVIWRHPVKLSKLTQIYTKGTLENTGKIFGNYEMCFEWSKILSPYFLKQDLF